jgi:Sortase domain
VSPPERRSRRGSLIGLTGLGAYGVCTGVAGVLVGIGFGPGAPPPASIQDGSLGRELVAAPLVPALTTNPVQPRGSRSRSDAAAVPSANVGRVTGAGASFRPTLLVLPGGRSAPVLDSGVHADGSLVIPDDPATVGWWNGGALAGDAFGSIVVAGHVDSARYGVGAMAQLKTLKTADVVELRTAGHSQRYRVTVRKELPQAELAGRTDAFRQDIPPRLVLITCGGAFDPNRHRYQDNLIIFADPVG